LNTIEILIPTYNQAHFIIETINSVVNQSFQEWQLTVVDNNSSDNTVALIKKKFKLQLKNKKIKIVSYNKTVPVMENFNRCLKIMSACKYFKFLCSDDILEKNYLKVAFNSLENSGSDIVGFSCSIQNFDNDKIINTRYYGKFIINPYIESIIYKNQIGCPSSVFLKYSAYKGNFFNTKNNYCGDLLYFIKPLLKLRKKFLFYDNSLLRVRIHKKTNTSKNFMTMVFLKERFMARKEGFSYTNLNIIVTYLICFVLYVLEVIYLILFKMKKFFGNLYKYVV